MLAMPCRLKMAIVWSRNRASRASSLPSLAWYSRNSKTTSPAPAPAWAEPSGPANAASNAPAPIPVTIVLLFIVSLFIERYSNPPFAGRANSLSYDRALSYALRPPQPIPALWHLIWSFHEGLRHHPARPRTWWRSRLHRWGAAPVQPLRVGYRSCPCRVGHRLRPYHQRSQRRRMAPGGQVGHRAAARPGPRSLG